MDPDPFRVGICPPFRSGHHRACRGSFRDQLPGRITHRGPETLDLLPSTPWKDTHDRSRGTETKALSRVIARRPGPIHQRVPDIPGLDAMGPVELFLERKDH